MIEEDEDKLDTVFPLPLWFILLAAVFFGYGCAAATEDIRVCFMQVMGQTETGQTVVAQQCMSPEAFAETQK